VNPTVSALAWVSVKGDPAGVQVLPGESLEHAARVPVPGSILVISNLMTPIDVVAVRNPTTDVGPVIGPIVRFRIESGVLRPANEPKPVLTLYTLATDALLKKSMVVSLTVTEPSKFAWPPMMAVAPALSAKTPAQAAIHMAVAEQEKSLLFFIVFFSTVVPLRRTAGDRPGMRIAEGLANGRPTGF